MSNFFKSKFFIGIIIITVLVLVFMIFSTVSREKSPFLSNAAGVIVTPVQKVFWNIGSATTGFFSRLSELREYKDKYEQAQTEITALEEKTRELYKLENENERLRLLLGLKNEAKNFVSVGAEVIAKDPGNWYNTFIIDKGTGDGISKNDAVMTDKGLVGYIYEVGSTWAKVMTIIDSGSSLGATVERTNDRAIVEGELELMEKGECRMSYISKDASVVVGDYVETSGLGGIYPKGLLIGKIKEIVPDLQGLYYGAIIETAVDFEKINEVLIITGTTSG